MTVTELTLRRLPVPVSEPPYDNGEPPSATAAVQGTLALAFVLPSGLPALPQAPPDLRLVTRPVAEEALDEVEFGPQPTPRSALPDPRPWAAVFAQAVVEAMAGHRPVGQLLRWTTAEVYDELRATIGPSKARAVVRSVHVSEPADGVAEVAALVRRGLRSTALAMRLEGLDGRWRCTALELG